MRSDRLDNDESVETSTLTLKALKFEKSLQSFTDALLVIMPDMLSNRDLVNLCLTSKTLLNIFEQAIADRFLRLIIEVNHLCIDVEKKSSLIVSMAYFNPRLMFMQARAYKTWVTPCEYIFTHPNLHLQDHFLETAYVSGMLDLYVSQSSGKKCAVNLHHLSQLFEKQCKLIDELEAVEYELKVWMQNHPDEEKIKWELALKAAEISNEITEFEINELGPAELKELPLDVVNAMVKKTDDDLNHIYDNPSMPFNFLVNYYGPDRGDPEGTLDLREYAGMPGKDPKNNFILTATKSERGRMVVSFGTVERRVAADKDRDYIFTLFNNYKKQSERNQILAVEMQAREQRAGKK